MAYVLTLIYFTLTLLTPAVLPEAIGTLPVILIVGILTILACIPSMAKSRMFELPDTYLVAGVLIIAMVSLIVPDGFRATYFAFMSFIPIIFAFTFIATSCSSFARLKFFVVVLFFVSVYIIAQGIIAERAGDITSDYLMVEGTLLRHRGLGVISDPNDTAQLFVTLLPLLWLRWKKGGFFSNFTLTLVPSAVLIVGIFLTHSRGGLFALCAVLLFGFKDKLGLVKSLLITGIFVVGLVILNATGGRGMNQDDGGRISLWGEALDVFRTHPIVGVGMNRFGEYSDNGLTAHNSYVLCLAEIGIIGYFCWMGTIVSSWTGLTMILATGKKEKTEEEKEAEQNPGLLPVRSFATAQPAAQSAAAPLTLPVRQRDPEPVAVPNPWKTLALPAAPAYPAWSGAGIPAHLLQEDDGKDPEQEQDDEAIFIAGARIVRASLAGLLVSAFFISRTYSMVFYIVFGVAAAFSLLYRRAHPEFHIETRWLIKRIVYVMIVSIIFLYVFVRFKGGA